MNLRAQKQTGERINMKNRQRLDTFVGFLIEMDNVQAERNELKLLVDPAYWRWSNRKLLKKIRRVGNAILRANPLCGQHPPCEKSETPQVLPHSSNAGNGMPPTPANRQ